MSCNKQCIRNYERIYIYIHMKLLFIILYSVPAPPTLRDAKLLNNFFHLYTYTRIYVVMYGSSVADNNYNHRELLNWGCYCVCERTRYIWRSYTQMAHRVGNDRVSLVPFVWENLHKAIKTVDENDGNK